MNNEPKRTLVARAWVVSMSWTDEHGTHSLKTTSWHDATATVCDVVQSLCSRHRISSAAVSGIEVSPSGGERYRIDDAPRTLQQGAQA